MAATASDSATSSSSAAAPALDRPIPAQHMHKNRLQEFSQKTHKKLPIYKIENEGEDHLPKFKCTVEVCGQIFSSTQSSRRRKEAEQDAARVACETLIPRENGDVKEVFELIDRTNTAWPSYSVARQDKPMTLFVASVVFDGSTYTGEAATSKKEAEQKAAYVAVKSILATANTCLTEIIRSKEILIKVFKSSQRIFTPIKFTRPAAYTEYREQDHVAPESQDQSTLLMTVQEHKIVPVVDPSVNPSTKAATHSRKRKGRGSGEERVVKEH